MTDERYYRFRVTRTIAALPKVRLQRRVCGPFFLTVGSMIPANFNSSNERLVKYAKDKLWVQELERLVREAYWSGDPVPTMIEL